MRRSVWAAPFAVEAGGVRAGVRASSPADTERFARALAHLVVDDPDVPENLSIRVGDGRRELHLLYWGTCLAVRTGDPARLLDAVALHAAAHGGPPPGAHRIDGCAVVGPAGSVVLPPTGRSLADALQRQLWDVGAAVVDAPWVDVSADGSQLLVPDAAPILAGGDPTGVLTLPIGREELRAPVGAHPLTTWFADTVDVPTAAHAYDEATAAARRGVAPGYLRLLERRSPEPVPGDRASLLRCVVERVS